MKKYVFMALAALCLSVAIPTTISPTHTYASQPENGLTLRILEAARVQFLKVGVDYSLGELLAGMKAGTVTVSEVVGGDGYLVSVGGGVVIVVLEEIT